MRPNNHDRFQIFRNRIHFEKVQLLEFDVFVLDKCLQNRDRAAFRKRRFLVPEDVTKSVLLPFHKIHHGARDGLLSFECGYARAFTEGHPALIDVSHLGRLDRFVAAFVIEY